MFFFQLCHKFRYPINLEKFPTQGHYENKRFEMFGVKVSLRVIVVFISCGPAPTQQSIPLVDQN